jgi:hypothetical protein
MNPRHLTAIKSSEARHRYFNELGATKLACLWVLENLKTNATAGKQQAASKSGPNKRINRSARS